MTAKAEPGQQRFLAPRYWGTWLAIGILKLLAPLSIKNQVRVAKSLGFWHIGWQNADARSPK